MRRVLTTDLQALNFILTSYEFEKPPSGRQLLGDIAGKGWFRFFGRRTTLASNMYRCFRVTIRRRYDF
jgi:hypothetical protein